MELSTSAIIVIARVCHQANKAWCEANGDHSQKDWEEAEEWQKTSAMEGVVFIVTHPDAGDDALHNNWMKEKIDAGWTYGAVKDTNKKTHPCLVSFEQLPKFQQQIDTLFNNIVKALC